MDKLAKTELFNLLINNSQTRSNHEMQHAYENFVREVLTLDQSETDYQTVFRTLSFTRIEFKTLQTQILCEQGKKCA